MDQEKIKKVHELTARLNQYRDEYYNQNAPSVTDEVYDRLPASDGAGAERNRYE